MTIHNGSLPSLASFCDKDSLLQSARLLLADEFAELDEESREEITSVKLYLTEKELLVANKCTDSPNIRAKLSFLRTHLLSEVDVELDPEDASSMYIKEINGHRRRFLYRLRQGAAQLSLWMSRIARYRYCVAASTSAESATTNEERSGDVQPQPETGGVSEVPAVELPCAECTKSNGLLPQMFQDRSSPSPSDPESERFSIASDSFVFHMSNYY